MKKNIDVENKKFAILIAVLLLILSSGYLEKINSMLAWLVNLFSIALAIHIQFKPQRINKLRLKWIELGSFIGKYTSLILISLIFILIFTPIGLFMRLIKRDELELKKRKISRIGKMSRLKKNAILKISIKF